MIATLHCPYCLDDQPINIDPDYIDCGGELTDPAFEEHTCYRCKKKFHFKPHLAFNCESKKVDCLNGAPHNWVLEQPGPYGYHNSFPYQNRCSYCDKVQTPIGPRRKPRKPIEVLTQYARETNKLMEQQTSRLRPCVLFDMKEPCNDTA